ncbi:MAG: glycoside hydrolase family 36 protein [Geodermatophilaceae bacterium]
MNYRPDRVAPADAFWGEGLLAVDPGSGADIHVFAAYGPDDIPSIRADFRRDPSRHQVMVYAEAPVEHLVVAGDSGMHGALARWAEHFAGRAQVGTLRAAPTLWCSWYHYSTSVSQADIDENLQAIDDLGLDIDVVQIDDGYQDGIGDWLALSDRFTSLPDIVGRIKDRGHRAGIWVAPFLVGHDSVLFREHPDLAVRGADAGTGWDQQLAALDATADGAETYLREVFGFFRHIGIDFLKLDFLYAGALAGSRADPGASGIEAYHRGMRIIREAAGTDTYVLGCGAPMLPSVGLVDAMRVGPDIAPYVDSPDGDQSQPSQAAAARCGRERAWQHGRFWVNDPDCLLAGSGMSEREQWAAHVECYGGLRGSSDRLRNLDDWGLAATRRLVRPVTLAPFVATGR